MRYSISRKTHELPAVSSRWLALAVGVALVTVLLDALSKSWITRTLGPNASRETIAIAGDIIELHYARNGGVAFGLLSGSSTLAGVLVGLLIVPLVIVLLFLTGRGPLWALAAGLVLGGAAGNLIDRVGDQMVTDFISVGRWPSFNLADSAITIGAILLIGLSVRDSSAEPLESD